MAARTADRRPSTVADLSTMAVSNPGVRVSSPAATRKAASDWATVIPRYLAELGVDGDDG
jgi:hypothetical protein